MIILIILNLCRCDEILIVPNLFVSILGRFTTSCFQWLMLWLIFSGIPCFECSEVLACAMKPGQPPNFNSFKGSAMVLTIFGFWSVLSFQCTEWNHRNRLDCSLPYEFPLSLLGDGFQEVYLLQSSNTWVVSKTELSSGSAHFVTFVSFVAVFHCGHAIIGVQAPRHGGKACDPKAREEVRGVR